MATSARCVIGTHDTDRDDAEGELRGTGTGHGPGRTTLLQLAPLGRAALHGTLDALGEAVDELGVVAGTELAPSLEGGLDVAVAEVVPVAHP